MKRLSSLSLGAALLGIASAGMAQTGPFDPESWPATIKPNATVHYVVTDGGLTSPGATWLDNLQILTGSDHVTGDFTIGGHTGKKALAINLNVADGEYTEWADDEFIDILVQAYGDDALFAASGAPRNFEFLIGTLPSSNLSSPVGGQVPVEAKNKRWNWVLFRIPNGLRPDGSRFLGSLAADAQGGTAYGGVNGGTIRFQSVAGMIVRVVAFGSQGAFGEPADINKFLPPETCDPEPPTNLVGLDLVAGTTNHLVILGGHDHTTTIMDNVGPAGDQRRAVVPDGTYLNFGITDNYLGKPCNDPHTIKLCVDFYDDPAYAGADVRFGPEAYATDAVGGIGFFPQDKRHLLQGTGQWIRRSWLVPSVNLKGVNADAFTAGPRFVSEVAPVAVSRVEMAVFRTGEHPLAGQDPLAACYEDLNICTDAYGNFAELDLANNIRNGLDVGTSTGDQQMIVEEAGPPTDRRLAVRAAHDDGAPGFAHQFLNFAILDQKLGPSTQPMAHLAICALYYDDPDLAGTRIKPEVYKTELNGLETFGFTPDSYFVTLQGSGKWREAYWEITNMKFSGVNQGPQAAARFTTMDAGPVQAKIAIARLRYGVIRPCGPLAGVNPIEGCKPVTLGFERSGNDVKLSWPVTAEGYAVQGTDDLSAGQWSAVNAQVQVVNGRNVVTLPVGTGTRYFRVAK